MNQPTECKHCGLHATWHIHEDTFCACGTTYAGRGDYWNQSTGCVEIIQSRERIQRAVGVLEGGDRIMMMLDDDDEDEDVSFVVPATDVDRAVGILGGEEDDDINSSKSPDSSPVTADDLAASDYFEAVRQRVPWMTSIEHIEGLVEGYRQCGLMAWRAAEQIKLIFGGKHEQAD